MTSTSGSLSRTGLLQYVAHGGSSSSHSSRTASSSRSRTPKPPLVMLCDHHTIVNHLKDSMQVHFMDIYDPSSIDVSITRNRSCDSNTTSSVSSTQEKYFFCTVSSPLDYLIRWKKYPDVSAASSELQIPVGHFEPYALYIFPVAIFLELVMKSSDGVDFPDLASYLEEKLFSWRNDANDAECAKVSFIIALVDLNNAALKVQQEQPGNGQCIDVQRYIDSAITFLLYELDVEVFCCSKAKQLCEQLASLTRLVADKDPNPRTTEIDWVMKAPKDKPPEDMNSKDREDFEIKQTWVAMLQMLPMMSKDKARTFSSSSGGGLSCARKVYEKLHSEEAQQLPLAKRKLLLQTEFGEGKNGAPRKEAKLAKHLYNLFTATDPHGLLSDV